LLWFACRHHVAEIVLSHVFKALKLEAETSPESKIFNTFRSKFQLFAQTDDSTMNFSIANNLPENLKNELVSLFEGLLLPENQDDYLPRGDYRELLQLLLSILNGKLIAPLQRPGATHKARWMNKLLYCLKIVLLEQDVIKNKICTKLQVEKFKRLAMFILTCYGHYWFLAPSQVNAPSNDLRLIREQYKAQDKMVSEVALKYLMLHTWYLCGELVPFALFSSRVQNDEKAEMVKAMMSYKTDFTNPKYRFGNGFGKPKLVHVLPSTKLSDLVNEDSWFFFKALKLDTQTDFLVTNVTEWEEIPSYKACCTVVRQLRIVNDTAERGVKLGSEYLSSAKGEERYQNVLQTVEGSYKQCPNLRKRVKKDDFKWILHV
jgi:hypothetical protein